MPTTAAPSNRTGPSNDAPSQDLRRRSASVVLVFALVSLATLTGAVGPTPPAGASAGSVQTFTGPHIVQPTAITVGPDEALWFASAEDGRIGRLTVHGSQSTVSDINLVDVRDITGGPDGRVWMTIRGNDEIGAHQPGETGIAMAGVDQTPGPSAVTTGPDGALWYTAAGAKVGRITTSYNRSNVTIPGVAELTDITAGPDGNLWITSRGATGDDPKAPAIIRLTPAGAATVFPHPGLDNPRAITTGPDGNLWFTNNGTDQLGRITPAGAITFVSDPLIDGPYDLATGPDGHLWFTNAGGNTVGRMTIAGTFTKMADISIPVAIVPGPDGKMWVTSLAANAIYSITTGVPPVGELRATTSPALPAMISLDGIPRDAWGLNWVKVPVLPGVEREVCFGPVPGYTPPPCQVVPIKVGETTEVVGTYTPRGYLRVLTNPAVPANVWSSDPVFAPRNKWGMWTDVDPGTYLVCLDAPADWTRTGIATDNGSPWLDGCVLANVTAGQTTTVTGSYTSSPGTPAVPAVEGPTGELRVTTDPAVGARILVDGIWRDSWGLTWMDIAPGVHEVCFEGVLQATAPACEEVTVVAGETTTVTGTPVLHGFLRVTTSPAVASTITVDGPPGWRPANAWGVWASLEPSPLYEVCFGDVPGMVTPPCQQVSVTAGQTTTVTGVFVAQ